MLIDKTLTDFLDELASNSPAPGGGSTAALMGSMAAALLEMVCSLTIDKPDFEEHWEELEAKQSELAKIRDELTQLIDKDTEAFNQVMAAFKLQKETEEQKAERREKIQAAFKVAAEVPMQTAIQSSKILTFAPYIAQNGNPNAASDVGVAASAALAALRGAALNVRINLGSIKDPELVQKLSAEITALEQTGEKDLSEAMTAVDSKING